MKIASLVEALESAALRGSRLTYRLIHTGQHYDRSMSGEFFAQLGLPEPQVNLEVGSGSHAEQTAGIMIGYERLLLRDRSDLCLVVGDITSTMACAVTAQKHQLRVAHVEAGIRSGDWRMPEEINRLVTDAVTNWFFTTSETANENLRRSGVESSRIFFVGNTMIDTLLKQLPRLRPPECWLPLKLESRNYLVVTLHRPGNVDHPENLLRILDAMSTAAKGLPVVFPMHPRTARVFQSISQRAPRLHYVEPMGYLEFNYLVKNALAVVTDSGGVTEETTVLGVPCLTLRDTTERPETVTQGTNELLGTDPRALSPALDRVFAGDWKKGRVPDRWDGRAGRRIVEHLERLLVDPR